MINHNRSYNLTTTLKSLIVINSGCGEEEGSKTQDQLDDNIKSLMVTSPKAKLQSQRISQDHRLLKSHTHRHPQVERQAPCTTPAGADKGRATHRAAGT